MPQTITMTGQIPDFPPPTPPYDDTKILARLTLAEAKIAALEAAAQPVPPAAPASLIYSPTSVWCARLADNAPLHSKNAGYKTRLTQWLRSTNAWLSIDTLPIYHVTDADAKKPVFDTVHTTALNAQEIAKGIPLPANVVPGLGGDKWVCILWHRADGSISEYNFWNWRLNGTRIECSAVGILHNAEKSDGTFAYPGYWNTVRAAHLPLAGGPVTKVGVEAGELQHALALMLPRCAKTFVPPAKSTDAESATNTDYDVNAIPMGARMRLPVGTVINAAWCPLTKVLVKAAIERGMIVCDTTKGWSTSFCMEDMRPYGDSKPFWMKALAWDGSGDMPIWKVVGSKSADGEFPWSKVVFTA